MLAGFEVWNRPGVPFFAIEHLSGILRVMRKTGSYLLAACALVVHFSATYSFVHGPQSQSRLQRDSCKFQEIFYKSLGGSKLIVPLSARDNLKIFCIGDNDQSSIRTSEPTLLKKVIGKLKGPATAVLTACAFFMIGMRSASARPPKSSKTISSPEKSTVKQSNNARQSSKTKQTPKIAEVELVIQKKGGLNSQLTRLGFVLVGVSTIGTLLTGDDTKKAKKNTVTKPAKKAVMKPTINWPIEIDEEEPDVLPPKKKPPTIPRRVRNGLNARNVLPTAEDLFSNSEEADLFFEVKPEDADLGDDDVIEKVVKKSNKISLPPSKLERVEVSEESFENDVEETRRTNKAVSNKVPENAPPPAAPAKKSIFDRIFQKRSTTRPTDLGEVLRIEDKASTYRAATATVLTFFLPSKQKIFSDVEPGGIMSYSVDEKALKDDKELRVSTLTSLKDDLGLETKEAIDAFADVVNSMIVSLTDFCVDSLDSKVKSTEESEAVAVLALNTLADFAISAGFFFASILPGVFIDDGGIKYNGKAQKSKLETLYYNALLSDGKPDFFKSLVEGILQQKDGEDTETVPVEGADQMIEDEEKHTGRLRMLLHLFSISDGKKTSLESKANNYKMMNMMGGLGDGGGMDLSALLGNMGKNGPMGMGMGPEDMNIPGMPGMSGIPDMPDLPDMSNMSEAEMQKALADAAEKAGGDLPGMMTAMLEALAEMRSQLAAGTVTRAQVIELERSLGIGIKETVLLANLAIKSSGQKVEAVPELKDLLDTFKQLLAIRNK